MNSDLCAKYLDDGHIGTEGVLLKVMFIYPQKVPSATHGVVYLVYYFIVCTKMKFIVSAFSFKLLALFCVLLHSVVML
jgi:hypothetical protein